MLVDMSQELRAALFQQASLPIIISDGILGEREFSDFLKSSSGSFALGATSDA